MRFLFYLAAILLLTVLQTAVIPYLPALVRFYDLMIPFAVYLSLCRPISEAMPALILAGAAMDMLSGAPIGIYLTSYFWIFLMFRQVPRWVGVREHVLFSWMVLFGVLFENALFGIAVLLSADAGWMGTQALKILVFQILWAIVTAPFLWICFQFVFTAIEGAFLKGSANGQ